MGAALGQRDRRPLGIVVTALLDARVDPPGADRPRCRILYLTPDPYHGFGGIAQYNRDLLDALSADDRIAVHSLPRHRPGAGTLPCNLTEEHSPATPLAYAAHALRRARAAPPDLLLCGHIALLPVAAAICRARRIPLVCQAYGIDAWTAPATAARLAVARVDRFLAISRTTRDRLAAWSGVPPARISVLPNAAPRHLLAGGPSPAELRTRYDLRDRRVLLTLGRIDARERYKGHDRILDVLAELRRDHPSLCYLIVGDGSDLPRLQALTHARALDAHVIFAGRIADRERTAHYRLADAFAMPSTGEGFGYVFLEAMACGTPVLGGSVDGGRDALADGELGVLVDPCDRHALLRGLGEVLRRPRGVPAGIARFGFDGFRARLSAILARLCAIPGGSP